MFLLETVLVVCMYLSRHCSISSVIKFVSTLTVVFPYLPCNIHEISSYEPSFIPDVVSLCLLFPLVKQTGHDESLMSLPLYHYERIIFIPGNIFCSNSYLEVRHSKLKKKKKLSTKYILFSIPYPIICVFR